MWLRQILKEVRVPMRHPIKLYCDNQPAIRIIEYNQIHSKIEHPDVRHMAVREREEMNLVKVEYISTHE